MLSELNTYLKLNFIPSNSLKIIIIIKFNVESLIKRVHFYKLKDSFFYQHLQIII